MRKRLMLLRPRKMSRQALKFVVTCMDLLMFVLYVASRQCILLCRSLAAGGASYSGTGTVLVIHHSIIENRNSSV
jgi:hypothetical protein